MQAFKIDILGTSFTIKTDQEIEYLQGLIAKLNTRIAELKKNNRTNEPSKLLVLLCITLLDELTILSSLGKYEEVFTPDGTESLVSHTNEDTEAKIKQLATRLIASIEESIDENNKT